MSRYRSSLAEALPDAVAAASAPSTIRSSFIKTGILPVMAAHVLERIAGSPKTDSNAESSSCETTAQWKEKLFGEFSPKKETRKNENQQETKCESSIKEQSSSIDTSSSSSQPQAIMKDLDGHFEDKKQQTKKAFDEKEDKINDTSSHMHNLQEQLVQAKITKNMTKDKKRSPKHSRKEFWNRIEENEQKQLGKKIRRSRKKIRIRNDDNEGIAKKAHKVKEEKFLKPPRLLSPVCCKKEKEIREKYYEKLIISK
ncbi:uncharacterized protein MONOS_7459 [Monocercomonoides exilis]|uniref:uncharacterized protein n=1 Tax=Monocercomonoides exilis TaxID=2049356 RepID=UPI00355A2CD1|nr:hypothetical protein MONOS_7459 [Monocercomonoides exilis]|eukprot:MONOS_7459.1-p1 / transcript=MONOS_7459.1 / gene=MONOS_7459 / organism=Monocercomonoides_exilis_PA203 / gene_product=unspecified product / transcript_product=unspecified product / location=Mono_scaffold00255:46566-47330(+) / protein_length=255 / sequence_SO=supercontig / SO=protein_coding / is_pseudo=false